MNLNESARRQIRVRCKYESIKYNRNATLIKNGLKTIETRSWKISYRGRLYIHVSFTNMSKEYRNNEDLMSLVNIDELNYGNIICSCNLVDCIEMTDEFAEKIKK